MSKYAPGVTVSHFRLTERLGGGATGEVFRCEDVNLSRPVALKFLNHFENDQERDRFLQEARLSSVLLHPNVAVVYEIGWDGTTPFVAMEFVEGKTLSHKIRNSGISRTEAILYAKQLLSALREAHSRGIIHHDISSSNIMVTPKGQVKLLDFGMARENRVDSPNPNAKPMLGTIEFLAPERAKGKSGDFRSDLFSAGVVLYHMLAGRLPFEHETRIETFTAILNEHPVPVNGAKMQLPELLEAVLQKSLAKDPDRRYQTASEFLNELEAVDTTPQDPVRIYTAEPIVIAVLYFERIGTAEECEYLRLGITEDIITDLTKIAGLRVLSRHAILKYKDKGMAIRDIIHELQVHYVLMGTVQLSQDRLRVTTQLVDGATGSSVWAERYERPVDEIFELQDQVSHGIAAALQIHLTDSEQRSMRRRSTEDVHAHEYYLRARYHYNQYAKDDNHKSETLLLKAVEIDPDFAAAYAALSETYLQRFYNWFDRDRVWLGKAEDAIQLAYKRNDQLPEVHCAMGQLLYLRGEYQQAMESIQKAIRLDPHYAVAHDHTGEIYLHVGELDKAIVAFHTEMRINGDVIYPYFYLVWIHSLLGDFSIAREILGKARLRHARNHLLSLLEGTFASYSGQQEVAEEYLKKSIELNPSNSFAMARLGVTYAEMGRLKQSLQLLEDATERVDPQDHHAAFDRACVMSMIGESERSLEWLNNALDLGWRCNFQFRNEPKLALVRKTTGFEKILDRLQVRAIKDR